MNQDTGLLRIYSNYGMLPDSSSRIFIFRPSMTALIEDPNESVNEMVKGKEAETSAAEELRKALRELEDVRLLQGNIGAFSMRQLFINEYINYVNLLASNPQYRQGEVRALKNYDLKKLISIIGTIFSGYFFRPKERKDNADVLILSRNRNVKMRTANGEVTGDYIFFSIVKSLKENHPEIRFKICQLDDMYFRYEHIKPSDLLRAIAFGLGKRLKWSIYQKVILSNIRAAGCMRVESCAKSFFSIRPLIRQALLAYDFDNIFSSLDPKLILANDDCLYTKPVNRKGTKVLVLQSAGMVEALEECRSIIFDEKDLLPDYYLSSGMVFADIKRHHHAAKKVVSTGLPRYDFLYNAPEVYSRDAFFKVHQLDSSRRMILWATQSHVLSHEENLATVKAILEAIAELKDTILVIKQHPAEGEEYGRFLREEIEEFQSDAIVTPPDSDTYELLSICDLHITRTSTTAREAVAMNKPVIILNLGGQGDGLEYAREGVALGVYKPDDLRAAIEGLLKDDSDLKKNRGRYIERYLYRIDGQSTQRVIDLVMESLKNEN